MADPEDILAPITMLIEGRNSFFRRNLYQFRQNREGLVSQFLYNEQLYIQMMNNIMNRMTTTTITIPLNVNNTAQGQSFFDPVIVAPTHQQINNNLVPYAGDRCTCAICQDDVTSDGVSLRLCNHVYHESCIRTWFSTSVRCPVCRRDIRTDHLGQT